MRRLPLALVVLGVTLSSPLSRAADAPAPQPPDRAPGPFERPFSVGAYATGLSGAYAGAGAGGRIRVEPWRWLGADLFGEVVRVQAPHGQRHDVPIGFHLFVPVRVSESARIRPFLGMCLAASIMQPNEPDAPRADDVLGGAHAGLGLDLAVHERISLFAEGKAVAWVGHDRTLQRWTGAVDNEVKAFAVGQAQLGVMMHLGSR